ncbi:MAG: type II toxin-antitoxin system VapC family toxin [Pseudomonadota bacterium]|nr:type II toxin-antitoxin system VapC family toxin [Pseudomonadota bacterium]
MNLLLDTHVLIWWLGSLPMLSADARDVVADPENEAFVSSASAFEIATKYRLGKLSVAAAFVEGLDEHLRRGGFKPVTISLPHALAAGRLPGPHKDPFDRMLIAQARLEGFTVVTSDPIFQRYRVPVVW